ncbi:MAG: hypothetical protein FJX77_11600 [Armatimonadetes bacterium]|nr:hypothetical protein [Armatimonadota bacterium]
MTLQQALDEFELLQRRRLSGTDREITVTAVRALREYLLDHVGLEQAGELEDWNLYEFLLDYYPSQEQPELEPALFLLRTAAAFSRWLIERGERATAPFLEASDRLAADLPRTLRALELLQEHTRRDDLRSELDLEEPDEEGEGSHPLGVLSAGLDRVARPGELDYDRAEEDYFAIRDVGAGFFTLSSDSLLALGQESLGPVRAPEAATAELRPGDLFHAEVAPGRDGWQVIEVFGIRPGGYL